MQKTHDFDGIGLIPERHRELLEILWAFKKPMTTAQLMMALENRHRRTFARNTILEHLKAMREDKHLKRGGTAKQFTWLPTRQKKNFVKTTADFKPPACDHNESIISHGLRQIEVLEVFWASDKPLIVHEVVKVINERLPLAKQLAYTTLLTITRNLHKRGSLLRHGQDNGRNHLYTPVHTQKEFFKMLVDAHCDLFFYGDKKLMVKLLKREYK